MPFLRNKFEWKQYYSTNNDNVVYYVCKHNSDYKGQIIRQKDGSLTAHCFVNGRSVSFSDVKNMFEARKCIMHGVEPIRKSPEVESNTEVKPVNAVKCNDLTEAQRQQILAGGDDLTDDDAWDGYIKGRYTEVY